MVLNRPFEHRIVQPDQKTLTSSMSRLLRQSVASNRIVDCHRQKRGRTAIEHQSIGQRV